LKDRKIVLAWCVQEEIGLRGAKALTSILRPKVAIIVDTISCCNPVITGNMRLGQGPAIRLVDSEFIGSLKLAQEIVKIAQDEKVPVQVVSAGGTTDALEIQELNIHTISIGVATKYTHSSVELCSVEDIKLLIDLLYKVVTRLNVAKFE
jgi:putative aminopeptidase FrvX